MEAGHIPEGSRERALAENEADRIALEAQLEALLKKSREEGVDVSNEIRIVKASLQRLADDAGRINSVP